MAQKPNLPDGTFTINKDDKKVVVELGKKLRTFLLDFAQEKKSLHIKIIAGAFQYFMEIEGQKGKLIGDDVALSQEVLVKYGLGDKIEEPFQDGPEVVPPTKEEQIKFHTEAIAKLSAPEPVKDADVEAAAIVPAGEKA